MAVAIAWLPGPAGTRRRVAKLSVEEPDAAEPARPDLWGARVSNDPGLPDRGAPVAAHGPDGSIPSLAARPLTSQVTSGSSEKVGHAPRPRAPAAAWPAHERPGGRVPGPCRLATGQEGRVARLVDDQGLIAIGVDWSV